MPTIDFSAKELASLKAHYASEHQRLTVQLSHVESMIQKLGGNVAKTSKTSKSTLTAKGVPAKKRGPKSIWGAFIQKRLRARNRPMTYEELIDDAMSLHKIPAERRNAAKASILNSAFRLRTVHGKITNEKDVIATSSAYDAEATVSPKGDRMVFTSTRNGDLDLYTCDLDGRNVRQVTNTLGYDGGAFFSPDGKWLLWRASRPQTEEEVEKYKALLEQNMVEPTSMELFVAKADGSEMKQITTLGGANWAPFFHPSGDKVLFSSNHKTGRFPFNIFMINLDGSELEQITFDEAFDSFPMFSPDGTKLAFSSNRNNGRTRNTNVFVADWVE